MPEEEQGWTLMTDGTGPYAPKEAAARTKRLKDVEVPEDSRSSIESFIAEHGVAVLLDTASQICDDLAHRKDTSATGFHIHSMLSLTLDNQISRTKAIEDLQEGEG